MERRWAAYRDLTGAMVLVGSSVVVGKLVAAELPVFFASALRFILAAGVLIPLLLWQEGLPRWSRRDHGVLFVQALCGSFLFSIFLLFGLRHTSAATAGILTGTTPAVVAGLGWMFLRERLSYRTLGGIACALLGVVAVNLGAGGESTAMGGNSLLGTVLILGAVVGEALFTIMRKLVSSQVTPLASATVMSGWSALLFVPLGIVELQTVELMEVAPATWASIVYYALVVTVIAFQLWFRGVSAVSASTAAVFTGVWPVSAVLLSAVVLREPLGWSHLLGIGGVLGGIVLLGQAPSEPQRNYRDAGSRS